MDLVKKSGQQHSQMGNFSREMETMKKNQIDTLEYINAYICVYDGQFLAQIYQQTRHSRAKNQWIWKEVNRNYPNFITKEKKREWGNKEQTIQEMWDNIK